MISKTNLRKMMSIILIICMMLVSTTTAFCTSNKHECMTRDKEATLQEFLSQQQHKGIDINKELSKSTAKITSDLVFQATEDLQNLNSIGIDCETLKIDSISSDNRIVYKWNITDGITDYIKVNEIGDMLVLDFYEGSLHNTIKIRNNGEILLDDFCIVNSDKICEGEHQSLSPNARYSRYSKTPLKGRISDYPEPAVRFYANPMVELGQTFKSVSVGALTTIIAIALSLSPQGQIASSIFGGIAGSIKSAAVRYRPNSTGLSYEIEVFAYKQNIVTDQYFMHSGIWYDDINFEGDGVEGKFFEENYFS